MLIRQYASATAVAQLLTDTAGSFREVLSSIICEGNASSLTGQVKVFYSTTSSSRSSGNCGPQPQQQRVLPDGPGLADFIRASTREGSLPSSSQASKLQLPASQAGASKRVFIETYGCQMNVSDSEVVSSILAEHKYSSAASAADADIVLLNTCAIRENAEARIWGRLGELQFMKLQRRTNNQVPLVVGVLGCMAERLKARLLDQDKLADLVVGPDAYRDLPRLLSAVQAGEAEGAAAMNVQLSLDETYADITPVRQDPHSRSAFVSIMRGCNNMCAFCIVPFTRGRERSRPMDSILREVEQLAEQGVREVTLLGQNVNSYADRSHLKQQQQQQQEEAAPAASAGSGGSSSRGPGQPGSSRAPGQGGFSGQVYVPGFSTVYKPQRDGAVRFAELLQRVSQVAPEMRVRFTSPHPKDFTDDVLQVIATQPNVCNYLHMPAQSGSSSTLARMRRGYTREAYDSLVQRVRAVIPNVALSTDIITGFCGETEDEHAATLDLLRTTRYDNAFLFSYSERGKTYASRHLADDVPPDTKARRLAEAFEAYRAGQSELNQAEVGRLHLVLLDGRPRRDGAHRLQGRTCTMKRAILPEHPLPVSLSALQQHLTTTTSPHTLSTPGITNSSSSSWQRLAVGPAAPYSGPTCTPTAGDYVAVYVTALSGTSTLMSQPLARTSVSEFVGLCGSSTPGLQQVPGWLQALVRAQQAGGWGAAAAAAAGGGGADGGCAGQGVWLDEEPLAAVAAGV